MQDVMGYRISAERVMGRWMVVVRCRWHDPDGTPEWITLSTFEVGDHEWSDPHDEVSDLSATVARRLG